MQKEDIHLDVILSDVEMPGKMNGFGFAQWARSVRPGVDIVLAGTPDRAVYAAHKLCEQGPTTSNIERSLDIGLEGLVGGIDTVMRSHLERRRDAWKDERLRLPSPAALRIVEDRATW
jgi:CheY-like chemotaxis protein